MNLCREADLEVEEAFFETGMLYGADEVFLTGTVTELLPIVRIDDRQIGNGKVGPITRRLYGLLRERALA